MKILYISGNSPWPPTIGSRMRSHSILSLLVQENQVTVALLHGGTQERAIFEETVDAPTPGEVVASVPGSAWQQLRNDLFERFRPIFKSNARGIYRTGLRELIERERPNLIWFSRIDTVWKAGCDKYQVPVVCDIDDFETKTHRRAIGLLPPVRRMAALADYPFLVRAQRAAARTCDLLLVSNPDDIQEAAKMMGRPARVAPNGFDYSSPPDLSDQRERRIVFYGALSYAPNVDGLRWFVRDMWPGIRAAVPDARLDIAGAPSPAVQDLAHEPSVNLVGFVESIRSFVDGAALLAVPLRMGGGTRIKILEAWALGLPVVSTSIGCEGLDAVHGETLFVADDPDRFSQACIDLLRSPALGLDVARRAYDFSRPRHDWQALGPLLDEAMCLATRYHSARRDENAR